MKNVDIEKIKKQESVIRKELPTYFIFFLIFCKERMIWVLIQIAKKITRV